MTTSEKNDRIDAISRDLVELGATWAKYGLAVGRQALEASAKSLTKTASLLGQIADAVDGKKPASEGEAKGAALSRRSQAAPRTPGRCTRSSRTGRAPSLARSVSGSSPRSRSPSSAPP